MPEMSPEDRGTQAAEYGDARLPDRFWEKVYPCPLTGCWVWAGAISKPPGQKPGREYGTFWWGRRNQYAHRVVFAELVAPVKFEVDHICRVTWCVNPDHLQDITHRQNWMRSAAFTVRHAQAQTCPAGHAYDETNTRVVRTASGGAGRSCRACDRARRRGPEMTEEAKAKAFGGSAA